MTAIRILIDADGCPVVDIAVRAAVKHGAECLIFCDTAHIFEKEGAVTITVSQGADSVDFALVNAVRAGDVVVTQDYGLAAMCLAKNAAVLNQDGRVYHEANIDALLGERHHAKKFRNAGGRTKGPPKRRPEQDTAFETALERHLEGRA